MITDNLQNTSTRFYQNLEKLYLKKLQYYVNKKKGYPFCCTKMWTLWKKEKNLSISNVELVQEYKVGKLIITDILKEKECWLSILDSQEHIKKFHNPK